MTEPRNHVEYLTQLAEQLNRLHDVTVEREFGKSDNARGDNAEQIAAKLRRRRIVRER
jgi:hypothetical protein